MTKQDYQLIARAIEARTHTSERELVIVTQVAYSIATELEQDNPKFDRNRFLTACGIFVTVEGNIIPLTAND